MVTRIVRGYEGHFELIQAIRERDAAVRAEALREARAWRDKYKPRAPESLMQVDSVNEALPELAEAVLDVIGYYKDTP